MTQIPLAFEATSSFDRGDYVITDVNHLLFETLMQPATWGAQGLLLVGPTASGKTHLATIWRETFSAIPVLASNVNEILTADVFPPFCVVEDIDRAGLSETQLFHLLNRSKEADTRILFTSARMVADWVRLPDARSRLNALPCLVIPAPDEALLMAVLRKQLSDRQMRLEEDAIHYLLTRTERSFAAIQNSVKTLDLSSLTRKQRVTIPLIRQVLESGYTEISESGG